MTRDYAEYALQFENCSIDASHFDHVDHVGVAHELLRKYSFLDAVVTYAGCLQTIATRAGAADKFNMTVTLAFLSLIAERMNESRADTFEAFVKENSDLITGQPLSQWYSQERLRSETARSAFLLPDRAA
jgi:hypothetical protein